MKSSAVELPVRPKRRFLPEDLSFDAWPSLEPWLQELAERELNSVADFEKWMHDLSEVESVIGEEMGWRFIRRTCDTANTAYDEAYNFFVDEIEPKLAPFHDRFNRKLAGSPFLAQLPKGKYDIWIRSVKQEIAIYREANIPLFTDIDKLSQQYAKCSSELTISHEGEELTMPKAANLLRKTDRELRKSVYDKIVERRQRDRKTLDDLFDNLCRIRQQVATNAGFENFRDYKFAELGRFDYTVQDCFDFHNAIIAEVVPMMNAVDERRRNELGLEQLRPYDLDVDVKGLAPLKPFDTAEELVQKTIDCLEQVYPAFANDIAIMREMKRFDIDSRKGKAPGGYNYPLHETGVPFIFMNAASAHRDVVTMVHEAGHAVHSFLMRSLELKAFRENPSEVDELASMSMELITMEHWEAFYPDPADLKRARTQQLEKIVDSLCWIAAVDKFQHWVYEHKNHTAEERTQAWLSIHKELGSSVTNWSGYEAARASMWQRQLHIFELPFYYIEYGFAQLGALAVWRNYKRDPKKAIADYEKALSLGYTKSIGEMYATAGIRFDFSRAYVKELIDFVKEELKKNTL